MKKHSLLFAIMMFCIFSAYAPGNQGIANDNRGFITVYRAIGKFRKIQKSIEAALELMVSVENGRAPPAGNKIVNWDDLIKSYTTIAIEIENSQLPAQPDTSRFQVSLDELLNCRTQENAKKKMLDYLHELESHIVVDNERIATLDALMEEVDTARRTLRVASEIWEKIILVVPPNFLSAFAGDIVAIEDRAPKSLARIRDAARSYRQKLLPEIAKLVLARDNLAQNQALLSSDRCILQGSWNGTCRPSWPENNNNSALLSISLKYERNLEVTAEIDGRKLSVSNAALSTSQKALSFSIVPDRQEVRINLSGDAGPLIPPFRYFVGNGGPSDNLYEFNCTLINPEIPAVSSPRPLTTRRSPPPPSE